MNPDDFVSDREFSYIYVYIFEIQYSANFSLNTGGGVP